VIQTFIAENKTKIKLKAKAIDAPKKLIVHKAIKI
jgi:hypothetical protein